MGLSSVVTGVTDVESESKTGQQSKEKGEDRRSKRAAAAQPLLMVLEGKRGEGFARRERGSGGSSWWWLQKVGVLFGGWRERKT